jgi:hypothetical protein
VKNNDQKYIIFTETAPLHAIKYHDQLTEYPIIILWFISEHPEKCQDSIRQTCHHRFHIIIIIKQVSWDTKLRI